MLWNVVVVCVRVRAWLHVHIWHSLCDILSFECNDLVLYKPNLLQLIEHLTHGVIFDMSL